MYLNVHRDKTTEWLKDKNYQKLIWIPRIMKKHFLALLYALM